MSKKKTDKLTTVDPQETVEAEIEKMKLPAFLMHTHTDMVASYRGRKDKCPFCLADKAILALKLEARQAVQRLNAGETIEVEDADESSPFPHPYDPTDADITDSFIR